MEVVDVGVDHGPLAIGIGGDVREVLVAVLETQAKTFSVHKLGVEDLSGRVDVVTGREGNDRCRPFLLHGASSDEGRGDEESRDGEHVCRPDR